MATLSERQEASLQEWRAASQVLLSEAGRLLRVLEAERANALVRDE